MYRRLDSLLPVIFIFLLAVAPAHPAFSQLQLVDDGARGVARGVDEAAKGARSFLRWITRIGKKSTKNISDGIYSLDELINESQEYEWLRSLQVELLRKDGSTDELAFEFLDPYFNIRVDNANPALYRKVSADNDVIAGISYQNPRNTTERVFLWKHPKFDDPAWNKHLNPGENPLLSELESYEMLSYSFDRPPAQQPRYQYGPDLLGDAHNGEVRHTNEFAHITSNQFDPGQGLVIRHIRLDGGGSGALIETPNNELILIDGGFTKSDYNKLRGIIADASGDNQARSLHIILTHTDRDHIGNVQKLIEAGQGFEEIIVPDVRDLPRSERKLNRIKETLAEQGYEEHVEAGTVLRYRKTGNPSRVRYENFHSSEDAQIQYGTLVIDESIDIKLAHFVGGRKVNDRSFLINVEHNGRRCLFTGDAESRALREIGVDLQRMADLKQGVALSIKKQERLYAETLNRLKSMAQDMNMNADEFSRQYDELRTFRIYWQSLTEEYIRMQDFPISSEFLVWPHHYWLPKNNKEAVEAFLRQVDPQFVILTQPPTGTAQHVEELKAYLSELKNKHDLNFDVLDIPKVSYENGVQINVQVLWEIIERYFG